MDKSAAVAVIGMYAVLILPFYGISAIPYLIGGVLLIVLGWAGRRLWHGGHS